MTEIDIPDKIKSFSKNFLGWHYQTPPVSGVSKTALAIIQTNDGSKGFDLLKKAKDIICSKGESVHVLTDNTPYDLYVKCLHNGGLTLQSRAVITALTRPMKVLVKGSNPEHVATICRVENHVVLTLAHTFIESKAVMSIIAEAEKLSEDTGHNNCLLKLLSPCSKRRCMIGAPDRFRRTIATDEMKQLQQEPTIKTLFTLNPKLKAEPCAQLVQATAILVASYEDAGSKFRDRVSRHEAARHCGEAIRTILYYPM